MVSDARKYSNFLAANLGCHSLPHPLSIRQGGVSSSGSSNPNQLVTKDNVPPASVSGCHAHRWIIQTPHDGQTFVPGTCRHCGSVRQFRAGYVWPDERENP